MTDLRTAAQQALEAFRMCVPMDGRHAEVDAAFKNLRAALAQQAEPVEPVAWQCREHGDSEWFDCGKESYGINPRRYTYRTLYTAPPQRKPLTEEVAALTTQRDALLEALQRLLAAHSVSHSPKHRQSCWDQARAAIEAVDEAKKG